MREVPGWVYIAAVVVLTVYAQLVIKWQVGTSGEALRRATGLTGLLRLLPESVGDQRLRRRRRSPHFAGWRAHALRAQHGLPIRRA